ncbi:MAG: Rieske (2Fe-2S) protein [Hydrocarboniphaga sp.]|uniref:aromatic ring-hydroxylating oxygenase subunit alpha n=1 Tax=Hydrocarboniphaga sp. TaxID=2033016 RepID=UPI00263747B5|nr:aromatic ring-hydroxylating dioxygenase subunit alpha [Hydrocarboniphaga sp.]MDB5968373.1 Rieske (2Fe-2S) protein [Hydrocarboniphaga sp.]
MAGEFGDIVRGFSSKASPLVTGLLEADSRAVPAGLKQQGNYLPPSRQIPLSRYYDPAFAELEKEKLWKKTWQYACREEDIPEVGDRYKYDVGTLSWFIVRSGPGEIRAFNNSCLHRGTQLCSSNGWSESIRCPFHAWEWKLDGSLKNIPSRWDFPQVKTEEFKLPEARVATWGGFVFINPDPDAAPLENYLGVMPDHFKSWEPENRFTAFHIRKRVRANWKITMEAFLESYHVVETHTESLGFTGDASTQYDIWEQGDAHISRLITPLATPSPHLGDGASIAEAANYAFQAFALAMPGVPVPSFDVDSKLSGRAQVAEWRRQMMGAGLARDFSSWPDVTMIDSVEYHMFPNFCPWYGEGLPLVYQFLPYGDDPNQSVMSVRLTAPLPGGGAPRPPSAPIREIGFDELFNSAPEIGLLAVIFDQDMSNLPRIQSGLRAASDTRAVATFGRYQEQRILHFHEVLEKTLGL